MDESLTQVSKADLRRALREQLRTISQELLSVPVTPKIHTKAPVEPPNFFSYDYWERFDRRLREAARRVLVKKFSPRFRWGALKRVEKDLPLRGLRDFIAKLASLAATVPVEPRQFLLHRINALACAEYKDRRALIDAERERRKLLILNEFFDQRSHSLDLASAQSRARRLFDRSIIMANQTFEWDDLYDVLEPHVSVLFRRLDVLNRLPVTDTGRVIELRRFRSYVRLLDVLNQQQRWLNCHGNWTHFFEWLHHLHVDEFNTAFDNACRARPRLLAHLRDGQKRLKARFRQHKSRHEHSQKA